MVFVWLSLLVEITPLWIPCYCCLSFPVFPHAPCVFCLFLPSSLAGLFCLPSLVLERKWSSLALDQPGLPSAVPARDSCSEAERGERLCAQAERACPAACCLLTFLELSGDCSKFILWLSGCRQIMARQRMPCWCQLISWLRSGFASFTRNCNLAPRVCAI